MASHRFWLPIGLIAAFGLIAAACGDDDSSSDASTTTTSADSTTTTSGDVTTTTSGEQQFVEFVQRDLAAVGCYDGPIDGIDGPETVAGIEAFQAAEGLIVDGEVGPQTQPVLEAAAAAGTTVCGGSSTTTPSSDPCDDVTTAMVESGATDFSAVDDWQCAADSDDRPWIGGTGTLASDGATADFVLEAGGDVAFVEYTGSCANPPVPESLLSFCET